LHRQTGEADQAIGMCFVRGADRIVESHAQLHAQIIVGPVHHRLRQRQRVHTHALAVHYFQAFIQDQ
jgi:hypothetical protein